MGIFSKKKPSSPATHSSISRPPQTQPQTPLSDAMIDHSIEKAHELITQLETNEFSVGHETKSLVSTFIALRPVILSLLSAPSAPHKLHHAHTLTQKSMAIFQNIFHQLLSDISMDAFSISEDIKLVADCMVASGYGKECMKVYTSVRKSVVENEMKSSGIPFLRRSEVKKMTELQLVHKIQQWNSSTTVAVNTIFLRERNTCDNVFYASDAVREACFLRISFQPAYDLLHFPDLLLSARKIFPTEMVFPLLDLHENLSSYLPHMDSIFSFKSTSPVLSQARKLKFKLGNLISSMLSSFGASVRNNSSKTVPGGGVHHLTLEVLQYISKLVKYNEVKSPPESVKFLEKDDISITEKGISPCIRWLILLLLCNLDKKADNYDNISLSYIFLANNLNCIVCYVVGEHGVGEHFGEEWVRAQRRKVKHYVEKYNVSAWGKVVCKLKENGCREEVREGFRLFNIEFEKTCRVNREWAVEDEKMREEMKMYVEKNVIHFYRGVYNRHIGILMEEKKMLVKFAPHNLESYMSHLILEK